MEGGKINVRKNQIISKFLTEIQMLIFKHENKITQQEIVCGC